MNIIATSDLHGYHPNFSKWGEVIVIAGDLTPMGTAIDVAEFSNWILRLAHDYRAIVFVAGNHDWHFQETGPQLARFKARWAEAGNIFYLEDSGCEIDGVKFWGSPWTPMFFNWAFMREDEDLKEYWDKIPDDTDVLVTHGPPFAILDQTRRGPNAGSETLRQAVLGRVLPKVHIFGHIHEAYGETASLGDPSVHFINAAYCDLDYEPVQPPIHVVVRSDNESA